MLESINVRFFVTAIDGEEMGVFEITESCFLSLGGRIEYKRHTMFENGCRQVCLTCHPFDMPEIHDIEMA